MHPRPDGLLPEGKKTRRSYPDYLRGFWDALRRAELKDGCIVLPEPHVWDEYGTRKIFVRDCYKALADTILRDAGLLAPALVPEIPLQSSKRCWVILGNPGP